MTSTSGRYRSVFSFYGGKSKLSHLYPEPKYEWLVEPFAGAAGYSLRYYQKRVWINEPDPRSASLWSFLLSPNALEMCESWIPDPEQVRVGDRISDLLPTTCPEGLRELLRSEANHGTQGARGVHEQITKIGMKGWGRIKPKMRYWIPKIAHWKLTTLDYRELPNLEATWFVDPPYDNAAGRRYRRTLDDYAALGAWCRERRGQTIVCENAGATWMNFRPLVKRRGIHSSYQVSEAMEVVWTSPTHLLGRGKWCRTHDRPLDVPHGGILLPCEEER